METLTGGKPSCLVSKIKVQFEALSEDVKREVHDFWTTQASRPTGDKKDFVRYLTGKSQYTDNAKHILKSPRQKPSWNFRVYTLI